MPVVVALGGHRVSPCHEKVACHGHKEPPLRFCANPGRETTNSNHVFGESTSSANLSECPKHLTNREDSAYEKEEFARIHCKISVLPSRICQK
ncbi:hypothetical protein J6590_015093 [Homalodisca vitripennis]|nr:hypothetical protein J6590_015093 [Homalodisca vitripennis]